MIGNAYPWRESDFVIVEEGELDALTLSLKVQHYHVIDKYGKRVKSGFPSIESAGQFIDATLLMTSSTPR